MPRTNINYANTIMYKFVCNDLNVTDVYVGNTTEFTKRKSSHKCNCNNENCKSHNLKVYQIIRANGGWLNWRMIEIKKYPCNDRYSPSPSAHIDACNDLRVHQWEMQYRTELLRPGVTKCTL